MIYNKFGFVCVLVLFLAVLIHSFSVKNNEQFRQDLKRKLNLIADPDRLKLFKSSDEPEVRQVVSRMDQMNYDKKEEGPSNYQNPIEAIRGTIINNILKEVSNNFPEIIKQTAEFFTQFRDIVLNAFKEYTQEHPNATEEMGLNSTTGEAVVGILTDFFGEKKPINLTTMSPVNASDDGLSSQ